MKIDFRKLTEMKVSPEVSDWMRKNGSNHCILLKAWETDLEYRDGLDNLLQCLAWAVQHNKMTVAERVMGRYRKVRTKAENSELKLILTTIPNILE